MSASLDIGLYLFVNAMTTVSVALFLGPPDFNLSAARAWWRWDGAGAARSPWSPPSPHRRSP